MDNKEKLLPNECCIPGNNEPSFVLLGRDPQAPDLVEQWAIKRQELEPTSGKPSMARDIAEKMRTYKVANPGKGMSADLYTRQPNDLISELVGALECLVDNAGYDVELFALERAKVALTKAKSVKGE